jgi:hypothetical protein
MKLTINPALTFPTSIKRKATTFELDHDDNSENIDPIIFLSPKRSCPSTSSTSPSTYTKPTNFFLARAPPSPNFSSLSSKTTSPRKILSPRVKTATPRIDTRKIGGTPLSAPAGRSPTRKRVGILNRRKTGTPVFGRVEPPRFGGTVEGGLGFSIDAALSGTIPSYTPRQPTTASATPDTTQAAPHGINEEGKVVGMEAIPLLHQEQAKESWFFSIHEDTEEELATNLMEHSTCILDISSDEESRVRERDFRGKENVAPLDDVSQTRTALTSSAGGMGGVEESEMQMDELKKSVRMGRRERAMGEIEVDREPLGALSAKDFYPEGCDESSVFILTSDESPLDENTLPSDILPSELSPSDIPLPLSSEDLDLDLSSSKGKEVDLGLEVEVERTVDELMSRDESAPRKAALLQPIEKAEEGWSLWESGSVDGE